MGQSLDQLDAAIAAAFASGHSFLILNLEALHIIDSSGIGVIVNALQQSKKLGGDTKLVNPLALCNKGLQDGSYLDFFGVYENEADALEACGN